MRNSRIEPYRIGHNLSKIFQATGSYLNYQKNNDIVGDLKMLSFNKMFNDKEIRTKIWSDYENLTTLFLNKKPDFKLIIEDLIAYEKEIWNATFHKFDLISYRKFRETDFEESQKLVKLSHDEILNYKFKINHQELFTIFKSKWNWNSTYELFPLPNTKEQGMHYFLRPTLLRGVVYLKNLIGIYALLPILNNNFSEFKVEDIVYLIKDGALHDYEIPSDDKVLINNIIAFLRENIIVFNSISGSPPSEPQTLELSTNRKSIVL